MNWFVFGAVYVALRAIRHRWFKVHHAPDREALIRAKAALVCVVHMETLLKAVDEEIARRQQQKEGHHAKQE